MMNLVGPGSVYRFPTQGKGKGGHKMLTCPICYQTLNENERLVMENYGSDIVIWHVTDFSERNREVVGDKTEIVSEYNGWCGKNFGSYMPSLVG